MFNRPPVTPFVECPNCKQLLEYGLDKCSRCNEEIRPEYALASAYVVHRNTQACSHANIIKSAEKAVVIVMVASICGYFLGAPSLYLLSLGNSLLSIAIIVAWFVRYGRFKLGDEDFFKARKDMRNSFLIWLALLLVQVLVFVYLLKSH